MADFKKALDWLNEGKRVRLPEWESNGYIFKSDEDIFDEEGCCDRIDFSHVFNIDWELYEEKPKHLCIRNEYVICYESSQGLIFSAGCAEIMVEFCPLCGGKKAAE